MGMRPGFKKVSSVWALSFNHRFIHDGLRMTSFYDAWDFAEHRMWSAFAVEEKRLEVWLESRLMLRGLAPWHTDGNAFSNGGG